jgi:site-specific recombinase XerD
LRPEWRDKSIDKTHREDSIVKLLDQVRTVARVRRLALRTEECYVRWTEQYIRFHKTADGFCHPNTLGAAHVEQFLTYLAVERHVSANTQNQALAALLFLYRDVLKIEIGNLDATRAHRTRRLPVVLSRAEVGQLLAVIDALPTEEPYPLMARLMYGAGLRLTESCRLRVKDVDLERNSLTIRQGKGDKDRVVMLPRSVREGLVQRMARREVVHERDRKRGLGWVWLPDALDRKYPEAPWSLVRLQGSELGLAFWDQWNRMQMVFQCSPRRGGSAQPRATPWECEQIPECVFTPKG